ncbi:MAG: hypothetical protein A2Y12_02315 [Planctomycetes bacterium GWF2_42_9]|nr:MAG: hypothetical protein A2Y12_02315 [Planctomycetes bacterium GWF2_42_9]
MRRSNQSKKAFTIVELLTVMGVIAILIGLLVPALNIVRRIAKDTKQRAQFHSIEVALEIFKNDTGEYPESSRFVDGSGNVTGAQRMTEALVGRDLQGYDPASRWHPQLDLSGTPTNAYSTNTGGTPSEQDKSLQRRKGPYLKLENVGAFGAQDLYLAGNFTPIYYNVTTQSPLMTDVYAERQVTLINGKIVKAGTPILYFKANTSYKDLGSDSGAAKRNAGFDSTQGYTTVAYNAYDNIDILNLKHIMKPTSTEIHPVSDATTSHKKFYDLITNPQISTNLDGVAYNTDSFILMSAGKDGLFGTADDIYNFGE